MRALKCLTVSVVLLVGTAGVVSGQSSGQARGPQRASGPLADSLRAFAIDMGAMLRAMDVDGVIRLYGDTAHFVHVDNGVVIAWSQMSEMMRQYFATAKSNPVEVIGEPGVTLIDRNAAVVYITHRVGAAQDTSAHEGIWTGVLRRGPAGWRIVHSHSSDRRPEQRGR